MKSIEVDLAGALCFVGNRKIATAGKEIDFLSRLIAHPLFADPSEIRIAGEIEALERPFFKLFDRFEIDELLTEFLLIFKPRPRFLKISQVVAIVILEPKLAAVMNSINVARLKRSAR